ncbi:type II toxin-antitoxin system PemK/MazF family toxin [Candidatus Saccharibacteria bacterium]|nr:type II toxin-antitoxin system PemK/MazF family toxin [Candidatus Saccharibacteria bacterium]
MKKNYEKWIFQKRYINNERRRPKKYIEGGIYWAYLGENIGFEQDGQGKAYSRPILIVRGFSSGLIWCLPISHTCKNNKYYYPIKQDGVIGSILLSQIRSIDTLRLNNLLTVVSEKTLADIKRVLIDMIIN